MKTIGLLGSTGSIGRNVLAVVNNAPDAFSVTYMTANTQVERLAAQAREFRPQTAVIGDESKYPELQRRLAGSGIATAAGYDNIVALAGETEVDVVVNAIVGSAGLRPTLAAAEQGRDIALSNKESLVMAGELINRVCKRTGATLYPVDSEHSAIWQCMAGESGKDVEKIVLTGSGGPFLRRELSTFNDITPAEALKHPNWSMGAKITVDSSTMVNKGLELIEAYHLFHLPPARIDILIHPESIVHSMVQFRDGSLKAQLGVPDMKVPIQYALAYPRHLHSDWPRLDLAATGTLHFEEPDTRRFPALVLARQVLEQGGTYPAVFNAANEAAVRKFLEGTLTFPGITDAVKAALDRHEPLDPLDMDNILTIAGMP